MKRFLKKIFLISIVPILVVAIFDVWLRNLNTSYSEKYNGLIQQKDSVQVLFLGNSHANYSIDPNAFTEYYAYNLANVSQRIYFDKRLTLKAIDEGVKNLKYVFISIDFHSFFTTEEGYREIWSYYGNGIKDENRNYFLANLSPFFWGYSPKVSLALAKKKIQNKLKYKDKRIIDFDVQAGVNLEDTVKQGFVGNTGQSATGLTTEGFKKRANYFKEPENGIREEVVTDLKDFIMKLEERGITPILFSSPTFTGYNQYLDKKIMKRNDENIKEICGEFNIQYWDYMDSQEFDMADFYDRDHMNKKGAAKFTRILSDRLAKYELTQANK